MPPESPLLKTLNTAQQQAVTLVDGPVLVIAGPGSGKTRVLTHRVAYLIRECGISSYNLMAVTFTNKAARVMKDRLQELTGQQGQYLTLGTFHAICARILRREAPQWGMDRSFVIYDGDDQLAVVKQALKDLNLDEKVYPARTVQHTISRAKDELIGPAQYNPPTYWHEIAARVYQRYQEILKANEALDFDDLIMTTVNLLRDNRDVREAYQDRYLYILVDEFQDTNTAQYELVRQLAGKHKNLFVVGDPDQSIYAWRGANIRNIRSFTRDFPQAQTVYLEENYRSTQTILDAADCVISRNPNRPEKHLKATKTKKLPLVIYEAYDEREEAEFVVREIQQLLSKGITQLGECAVMYRTNAQSRVLEDAFVRHNIPYKLVGATRFYERREIKDVLAYLRLIHNPFDNFALLRIINVPPRRIGAKTITALQEWAAALGIPIYAALQLLAESGDGDGHTRTPGAASPPFVSLVRKTLLDFLSLLNEMIAAKTNRELVDLLDFVLDQSGYVAYVRDGTEEGEDRWANIMELRSVAQEYSGLGPENGLTALLEEIALMSDVDGLDEKQDAVTLLTLHTAKGLEFDAVFMVGMEEGILPHSRSRDEPEQMEEERRLCYVGITRARDRLYLVHTFRRTLYGSQAVAEPSRFLRDIPDQLVQGRGKGETKLKPASKVVVVPSQSFERPMRQAATVAREIERERQEERAKERQPRPARQAAFTAGDQVRHTQFGEGIVINSEVSGDDELVTVAFVGKGIKRLAASMAPLTKV